MLAKDQWAGPVAAMDLAKWLQGPDDDANEAVLRWGRKFSVGHALSGWRLLHSSGQGKQMQATLHAGTGD